MTQLLGVLQVVFTQVLGAAENVMFRHIGRVTAGQWLPPKRLGERANMMRTGAAAR